MKHLTVLSVIAGALLALPVAQAAMNNQDVIKMHNAGLSDETIVAAMKKEQPAFDTSTDALIGLKTAGVSETVIQMMLSFKTGESQPATPAAPPATSAAAPVFRQNFPSIAPSRVEPAVGKDYFTRFTFHEEKNEHITTNYARGGIVPINTPVKLVSMSGSRLVLKRGDDGREIKVKNEEKYSKKTLAEIASLMLSAEPTDLGQLPEEVAAAIRSGEMRKGMTKELVLMARGYPPAHETASIESDRWVYWSSRFVKHTVVFADGRLAEGRGLF